MKTSVLMVCLALAAMVFQVARAEAFQCPKHFQEAQTAIDKVTEDMKGQMSQMVPKEQMALVHAFLDDAKTLLESARHNHEKPQGEYDHSRAIAKAGSARAHAVAADLLHSTFMRR